MSNLQLFGLVVISFGSVITAIGLGLLLKILT